MILGRIANGRRLCLETPNKKKLILPEAGCACESTGRCSRVQDVRR